MSPYSKAIAAVVGAIAAVLVAFNIDVSEEVQAAVITVVTAAFVYFAPKNEPAPPA
jgi:hypothetical protein